MALPSEITASAIVNPRTTINTIAFKLDENNFVPWRRQALAFIKSNKLKEHLDPRKVPRRYGSEQDRLTNTETKEFDAWEQEDQFLVSWFFASMDPEFTHQLAKCEFAYEIWFKLKDYFAKRMKSKVKQLKTQIKTIKLQGSVIEYISKIKKVTNSLSALGAPLTSEEFVEAVAQGLNEDYSAFITMIISKADEITQSEVEALLVGQEELVERFKKNVLGTMHVNLAQGRGQEFRGRARGRGFRGGRSFYYGNSRPQCQLCGRIGHIVWDCYHRFNQNYQRPYEAASNSPAPPSSAFHQPQSQTDSQPRALVAAAPLTTPLTDRAWYLDTGASHHLIFDGNNLVTGSEYEGSEQVFTGNGQGMCINNIGRTILFPVSNPPYQPNTHYFKLLNLLHVSSITKNLISVAKFAQDNHVFFEFHPFDCFVKDQETNDLLLRGSLRGGLYQFDNIGILARAVSSSGLPSFEGRREALQVIKATASTSSDQESHFSVQESRIVWHRRLGHPAAKTVAKVMQRCKIVDDDMNKRDTTAITPLCNACCQGKHHNFPFSDSLADYNTTLELVYSDIWRPAPIISSSGFRYYIIFIDAKTRYTCIYLLQNKAQALQAFTQYKLLLENKTGHKIKSLQTDNGGEFLSHSFTEFLIQHGIAHRLSCPHTHQQNGRVERKHRHITEMGLTLLSQASLPLSFWDQAFLTATHLINLLPSYTTDQKTPFELLNHKEPDYLFLKTFECACYPQLKPHNTHKFNFKTHKCLFLGYSSHHKGYKCLSLSSKLYVSKHVLFDESEFPSHTIVQQNHLNAQVTSSISISNTTSPLIHETLVPNSDANLHRQILDLAQQSLSQSSSPSSTPLAQPESSVNISAAHNCPLTDDTAMTTFTSVFSSSNARLAKQLERRHVALPTTAPTRTHPMVIRSRAGIFKPKLFTALVLDNVVDLTQVEPSSVVQALTSPHWKAAMDEEYAALLKCKTWNLVEESPIVEPIGCRWVFRIKRQPDGTIQKYKASLVAKSTTVRTLLSIAVSKGWRVRQFDFNNAFLNGDLHEKVYMVQPEGYALGSGLAPRAWFLKLSSTLRGFGFASTTSDPCLFVRHSKASTIYFLAYVDDILMTGTNQTEVDVERTKADTLVLKQSKYVKDLLNRVEMLEARPVTTPMASTLKLDTIGTTFDKPFLYRSIVGGLQYATITRPDIAFSVNKVSQFMHAPLEQHWKAVKRILRYLAGTIEFGLEIPRSSDFRILTFCDSDWTTDPVDRRSTTGYYIFLGVNLINWSSRKQTAVARSSAEAEFRALADAMTDTMWLQKLLHEMHIPAGLPPTLFCDNQSTMLMSQNPILHSRSKHFEIDLHFVRHRVEDKQAYVVHIPSQDQIADVLTKPVSHDAFLKIRCKLRLVDQAKLKLRGNVEDK
ncbi:hypothetical protein AAHE18_08G113100 [Arachis hypogaea]